MSSGRLARFILLFACTYGIGIVSVADAAMAYRLDDLGYTSDYMAQWASINNLGRWVALSSSLSGPNVPVDPVRINDEGQVTGMFVSEGQLNPFFWNGIGLVQDLGTLGGDYGLGWGLNNSGQVVGESRLANDSALPCAFLYSPSVGMVNIDPWGGAWSSANSISDREQIVGWGYITGGGIYAFFRDSNGQVTNLGTLGGNFSKACDINDKGQIVGSARTAPDASGKSYLHACLWTPGEPIHDLGTLGGESSVAYALNDNGQAVGEVYFAGSNRHAVLFDGSAMIDLNEVIDQSSGWILRKATDINNRGQIVGWGVYGGKNHAFMLTPVPEPATLGLTTLGGLILALRRRRKTLSGCVLSAGFRS